MSTHHKSKCSGYRGGWTKSSSSDYSNLVSFYPLVYNSNDYNKNYNGISSNVTFSNIRNNGAYFNGTTSLVSYQNQWHTLSSFTISIWVKPTVTPTGYQWILDNRLLNTDATGAILYCEYNGTISFLGSTSNAGWTDTGLIYFGPAPISGIWTNYTIVKNGTSLSAYTNGVLTKSTSASATGYKATQNTVLIGQTNVNQPQFHGFNGSLSRFAIYNRALNSTEILENYNIGN